MGWWRQKSKTNSVQAAVSDDFSIYDRAHADTQPDTAPRRRGVTHEEKMENRYGGGDSSYTGD
jgi:hypothetical protein